MWEPSSEWSGLQRAESSSGKRAVKRRSSVRGVSPRSIGSSKSLLPVPSPPACLVTHVVTSIYARLAFGCTSPEDISARLAFGCTSPDKCPLSSGLLLPVEVFGEPVEVERAQE